MGMRRIARSIICAVPRVAIGLLLLIVITLAGLKLYFDKERTARLVGQKLSELLQGRFHFDAISWRLPPEIDVRGMLVQSPRGDEVLRVDHLRISLSLPPLIHRTIHIQRLSLDDAHVQLAKPSSTGAFTLLEAFQPQRSNEPSAWTIEVADIEALGLDVDVETPDLAVRAHRASLRGGALTLSSERQDAAGRLLIEEVGLEKKSSDPKTSDLGSIDLALEHASRASDLLAETSSITLRRLSVRAVGSSIDLQGTALHVPDPRAMVIDVRARASIDASNPAFLALMPERLVTELAPRGIARLDLDVKGRIDDARLRLLLEGEGLEMANIALERVLIDSSVHRGSMSIEPLEMDLDGGRLRGRGTIEVGSIARLLQGERPLLGEHRLEARIDRLPIRKLGAVWTDPSRLPGSITASIAANGRSLAPLESTIDAGIDVDDIPAAPTHGVVRNLRTAVHATLGAGTAHLDPLRVDRGSLRLVARGTAPLDPRRAFDLSVQVADGEPNRILAALKVPIRAARIGVDAHARGTIEGPLIDARIAVDQLAARGIPPADVRIPLKLERGTVLIEGGRVHVANGDVYLEGNAHVLDQRGALIQNPELHARVTAGRVGIGDLTEGRARGTITATVTVDGPLDDYQARGVIMAPGLAVGGASVAAALIAVEGNHKRLVIRDLYLAPAGGAPLTADGEIRVAERMFRARVESRAFPIAFLSGISPSLPTLTGTIALGAKADGDLSEPRFDISLDGVELGLEDRSFGDVHAHAAGDFEEVSASIVAKGEAGEVHVDGRGSPARKTIDAHVTSNALSIRRLLRDAGNKLPLAGDLSFDVAMRGTLPRPDVDGAIHFRKLELDDKPLPSGTADITISTDRDRRDYRIEAELADAVFVHANIEAPPSGHIAGKATAELRDLSVERLIPSVKERGLKALIAGEADVSFGDRGPARGRIVLNTLSAEVDDRTLEATEPIRVRLEGSRLDIESFRLAGTSGRFELEGSAGATLALRAKGALELGLIQPFIPQLTQASGTIDVALNVSGTSKRPEASGQVSLQSPIALRPRGSPRMVEVSEADIGLSPSLIAVNKLAGTYGGGAFQASGTVALAGIEPSGWDLRLSGTNLPIQTQQLQVDADARLRVTGSGPSPHISGELGIVRGRYLKEVKLEQFNFIAKKQTEELAEPKSTPPPILHDVQLDLRAVSTGPVNVRFDAQAFSVNADLDINLHLKGSPLEPQTDGRILVESGEITFPAAKLPITGSVDLVPTPSRPIHPVMNVTAEGDVRGAASDGRQRDFHVTVALTGPLDQMQIDLSAPDISDKTDVLSLLITGNADILSVVQARQSQAEQPPGTTLSPTLAFAGSQLAAPLSSFFQQQLNKELNLQLELRTEVTAEGFRVVAGRQVGTRIHIEGGYGRSFPEGSSVATGSATLQLTDRVLFEGGAQTLNAFGSSVASLQAGSAGRLELKLRVFGSGP
jgi:hypothetical protein